MGPEGSGQDNIPGRGLPVYRGLRDCYWEHWGVGHVGRVKVIEIG